MRIAIISDIHGNFVALDAALADIDRADVDRIVCLGDVAANGPQPRECISLLRDRKIPTVMGNTDEYLLKAEAFEATDERMKRIRDILQWSGIELTGNDRDFLTSFKPTLEFSLDPGDELLCFHGSPRSNEEVILATTPEKELGPLLGDAHASVMAGGHTHVQMLRRFRQSSIINPGSVGLPFEITEKGQRRPPWAEYAVVSGAPGDLDIKLRRINYNVELLANAVRASGMPHGEWWLSGWTGYF